MPAKKDKENFGYAQETARPSIVQVLTRERRAFLGFIRKRVRTNEEAEEILQAAYAKGLRHLKTIENNDNTVAWFFRIIRNSLADHWRHEEVKSKALEELAHESAAKTSEIESELEKAVCGCMNGLMKTIKPECAEILQEVDLRDMRLRDFATARGLSLNNATVRIHRARKSLKERLVQACGACAEHACLNCDCKQ